MASSQDVIVDTQWVADNLSDSKVKLIEVDVDTDAYDEGHIEGAVAWNWTSQLQDQVRRDIIGKGDLENLLGKAGELRFYCPRSLSGPGWLFCHPHRHGGKDKA